MISQEEIENYCAYTQSEIVTREFHERALYAVAENKRMKKELDRILWALLDHNGRKISVAKLGQLLHRVRGR